MPALEPLFYARLIISPSRDTLDKIRDLIQAVEISVFDNQIGESDMAGFAQLLTVPDDLIIKKSS
jgi:hypothetical protein